MSTQEMVIENMEPATDEVGSTSRPPRARLVHRLALDRLSGVYAWLGLFVLFALWVPETFVTAATARSIGANSAVTLIAALALIVPLACGLYDLSVAATLGVASVLSLHLQVSGMNPFLAIAMCMMAGALIGAVNGFLVVRVGVSSFIATLGMTRATCKPHLRRRATDRQRRHWRAGTDGRQPDQQYRGRPRARTGKPCRQRDPSRT